MKILIGIVVMTILTWALSVGAIVDPVPEDESKPELVKRYIFMSCDLLDDSYTFQFNQLEHVFDHLKKCKALAAASPEYTYGPVMCLYIHMQWQFLMDHLKSVEKAYNLTCDDWGEKKERQYEIDF